MVEVTTDGLDSNILVEMEVLKSSDASNRTSTMGREGVGFIPVRGSPSAIEFSEMGLIRSSPGSEEEASPEEIFADTTLVVVGYTMEVVVG